MRSPLCPVAPLPPQQPAVLPRSLRGRCTQALPAHSPHPLLPAMPCRLAPSQGSPAPTATPSLWPRDLGGLNTPTPPLCQRVPVPWHDLPTSTSRHIRVPPSSKKTPGPQGWVRAPWAAPPLYSPHRDLCCTGDPDVCPLTSPATLRLGLGEERRLLSLHSEREG